MSTVNIPAVARGRRRLFGISLSSQVLTVLCLMYLVMYIDRVNIAAVAPRMTADLGLSNTEFGLAVSAFSYPYALFQLIGGWVSDRFGPRRALMLSGVVVCVATICTGLVGGLSSLIAARVALGFGEGSAFPTATRALSVWMPRARWGFAQGITHSASRLGNALAPPLIAGLMAYTSWRGSFVALGSLLAVATAALLLTALPRVIGAARLRAVIQQGRQATAQTTLRWAVVLLLVLLVAAARFGLDVVLGAMLAGMVLRTWTRRMGVDVVPLETKLEAVGYGIFIPIFFVASGMTLDIHEIISAPLRLLVFLLLLLVEMTFITATTMPLLIALTEIGLKDGTMLPANAAALVGAGVLSVLLYPSAAAALRRRGQRPGGPEAATPEAACAAKRLNSS